VIVFVDTSALYALVDGKDPRHGDAIARLGRLKEDELVTHAYIVVESLALVGRRLPWDASLQLLDTLLPLMESRSVDQEIHRAALAAYREAGSAHVSFVDRASFAFMRAHAIGHVFAFDTDFAREGFEVVSE